MLVSSQTEGFQQGIPIEATEAPGGPWLSVYHINNVPTIVCVCVCVEGCLYTAQNSTRHRPSGVFEGPGKKCVCGWGFRRRG